LTKPSLKVAVVTEWHPFNVIDFQRLFATFDEFEVYIQSFELLAQDEENYAAYDVLVFYNLSIPTPAEDDHRRRYLLDRLGKSGQGIVLLHHAVLSYPQWPFWNAVSGTADRTFKYFPQQTVRFSVVDSGSHPISRGVRDFTMIDETYAMGEPSPDNDIIVTTDHPKSVRAIAWTRQFKNSRVFCYLSGHDRSVYENVSFRQVLRRGMLWAADRLE
jgi:type 1 glutamine amidotransferase